MKSYSYLSDYYDLFTQDVPYAKFIEYYEEIFKKEDISPEIILDLACGTGTISIEFSKKDYEMIGVDLSSDMLNRALDKSFELTCNKPLFLCQSMDKLDLYGTVDACVCALDSVNYVTDKEQLKKAFSRVQLFLNPGGIFIFDINSVFKLKNLDGNCYIRQNEDIFCSWQIDIEDNLCYYDFDFFEKTGENYKRYKETHVERLYTVEELTKMLKEVHFTDIKVYGEFSHEAPSNNEQRIFFTAKK